MNKIAQSQMMEKRERAMESDWKEVEQRINTFISRVFLLYIIFSGACCSRLAFIIVWSISGSTNMNLMPSSRWWELFYVCADELHTSIVRNSLILFIPFLCKFIRPNIHLNEVRLYECLIFIPNNRQEQRAYKTISKSFHWLQPHARCLKHQNKLEKRKFIALFQQMMLRK